MERICEFFTEGKADVNDDGSVCLSESQVIVINNFNDNDSNYRDLGNKNNKEGNKKYDNKSIIIYDDFFKK
jgi:hypothetical protein